LHLVDYFNLHHTFSDKIVKNENNEIAEA